MEILYLFVNQSAKIFYVEKNENLKYKINRIVIKR